MENVKRYANYLIYMTSTVKGGQKMEDFGAFVRSELKKEESLKERWQKI